MALEQIKKAEQELQDFMVYYGRAGLWDDFIIFQAKARKARLEAKNAHIQKINKRMHIAGLVGGLLRRLTLALRSYSQLQNKEK